MTTIYVDLSKANAEFERMVRGKIPFDPDYLRELIETSDNSEVRIDFNLNCECGGLIQIIECPECKVLARDDCPLCDGAGHFLDCLNCSGGEEVGI